MITQITVERLFGSPKPVTVSFNKDITFLVGMNGSGKTTILNLVASVATGNLNNLFNFDFTKLTLTYLSSVRQDERTLVFTKNLSEGTIHFEGLGIRSTIHPSDTDLLQKSMIMGKISKPNSLQAISSKLARELKLMFLPLSRGINVYTPDLPDNANTYKTWSNEMRIVYRENDITAKRPVASIDESLSQVSNLIREKHRRIMTKFEELNEEMKNTIFETLFTYDNSTRIDNASLAPEAMVHLRNALHELGIDSSVFDKFFNRFSRDVETYRKLKEESQSKPNDAELPNKIDRLNARLFLNSVQFSRIRKMHDAVNKIAELKQFEQKPITDFISIVNRFIGESGKKIEFDSDSGALRFYNELTPNLKYELEKMSSGEKQIIIFFAYLIFQANSEFDTFIIDEPELSLHIAWQSRFCSAIMEVSPNLQLIFATHSPDIIGALRDKCVVMGRDHA